MIRHAFIHDITAIKVSTGGGPTGNWILTTGNWDDAGEWDDTAVWID